MQIGDHKFIKTEFTDLTGKKVIAFTEDHAGVDAFTIKVAQTGMKFSGTMHFEITSESELQDFAKMISDIWTQHRKLAPKITTTASGH